MKKIFPFLLPFFLCGNFLHAQMVTVIDYTTRQTIPGVVIYSSVTNQSVATDASGKADVSALSNSDTIHFRQFGYQEIAIAFSSLAAMNYVIELKPSDIIMNPVVISANRWETEQDKTP